MVAGDVSMSAAQQVDSDIEAIHKPDPWGAEAFEPGGTKNGTLRGATLIIRNPFKIPKKNPLLNHSAHGATAEVPKRITRIEAALT